MRAEFESRPLLQSIFLAFGTRNKAFCVNRNDPGLTIERKQEQGTVASEV